jgi:hypothetical protein
MSKSALIGKIRGNRCDYLHDVAFQNDIKQTNLPSKRIAPVVHVAHASAIVGPILMTWVRSASSHQNFSIKIIPAYS